ncbi:MAG: S8 family peptidase [Ginsengibacter sp.]
MPQSSVLNKYLVNKISLLLFLSLILPGLTHAQFTKYIIKFENKTGTPFSINNPTQYLSLRSIQRRVKQHIAIDETDLPIVPAYIDSLRLSGDVTILDQSKWLNQVCIETNDGAAVSKINSFSFVVNTIPLLQPLLRQAPEHTKFNEELNTITTSQTSSGLMNYFSYGNTSRQIEIHHGEYLHNNGFHGEGMMLALLDAGYYHYLSLPAFDSVRLNNQIGETYDFVNNEVSVDEDHPHVMQCFSIIGGNIPGQFVGSAPKATFFLYRTENVSVESPVEEQYWAAAAERADSIGVDVISSSLGYGKFDNPIYDYTYSDMDGNTTVCAKAADLAAKKGMIVVVAAGNEGTKSWHFILTPGDADSVLTVGAVNASGIPADFSSYGPSSDGRVKPTVASIGAGTALSSSTGEIVAGNGTSFATPNMAGLVTCLWQAFPDFSNMEIIDAVMKSSSRFNAPDDRVGYGIPDFQAAFKILEEQRSLRNTGAILGNSNIKIYPNPFGNEFSILLKPIFSGPGSFGLYDASGKLLQIKKISLQKDQPQFIKFESLQTFPKGIYILRFSQEKTSQAFKLIMK